jgi:hypothetical protein
MPTRRTPTVTPPPILAPFVPPAYLPLRQRRAARLAYARSMRGWYWRAAVLRWTGRAAYRTGRFGWVRRRALAPLYVAGALQVAGAVLSGAEKGYATALVLAALGAGAAAWRLHGLDPVAVFRRRRVQVRPRLPRRRLPRRHAYWVWSLYTAGTVWLTTAATVGAGPPMPGLLALGTVGWGGLWWWHNRPRPGEEVGDWLLVWEERVGGEGKILPGAELADYTVEDDTGNWSATIELVPGRHTTADAVRAAPRIASSYRKPMSSVVVEPPEDSNEAQARMSVLNKNMLEAPQEWPGPQLDLAEGLAPIGPYHDGELARFRFWLPDSGAVHSLVSGCTGSGKSMFVGTKLATERFSGGLVCSWVCCPQGGMSFPEWMGNVALSVDTAQGGADMLKWAIAVMDARARHMATADWVDDRGRRRRGMKHFTPTPEMPLLSITIEESPQVMAVKGTTEDAEQVVNTGRKVGVSLTFVTQVPLLGQLGNSTPLRAGLTSGNVVVFRTADRISGHVSGLSAIDSEGVDPYKIPRRFPDGSQTGGLGYTLGGSDRPALFRSYFDPDPVRWSTEGAVVPLDALSQAALDAVRRVVPDRTVVPLSDAPSAPTVGARVVEYLEGVGGDGVGPSRIAEALGLDRTTVSPELARLEKAGRVHKARPGWWAAGPGPGAAADEGEPA